MLTLAQGNITYYPVTLWSRRQPLGDIRVVSGDRFNVKRSHVAINYRAPTKSYRRPFENRQVARTSSPEQTKEQPSSRTRSPRSRNKRAVARPVYIYLPAGGESIRLYALPCILHFIERSPARLDPLLYLHVPACVCAPYIRAARVCRAQSRSPVNRPETGGTLASTLLARPVRGCALQLLHGCPSLTHGLTLTRFRTSHTSSTVAADKQAVGIALSRTGGRNIRRGRFYCRRCHRHRRWRRDAIRVISNASARSPFPFLSYLCDTAFVTFATCTAAISANNDRRK